MKKSPLILLTLSAILSSCSNSPTPAPKKEAPFKNLILVIGDGMGLEHVAGAKLTSDQDYKFTTWNQAVSNTNSLGSVNGYPIYTTDSAASATAMATGEITLNGYIGKDRYARDKETIMDYAKSLGKSTAIVTTDVGYGATPAAFSAHAEDRYSDFAITASQAQSGMDIIMCQTSQTYTSARDTFIENGYEVFNNIITIDPIKSKKFVCHTSIEEAGGPVEFIEMVKVAIESLSQNTNGYCLMIEEAYIDKNAHSNKIEKDLDCVDKLNNIVNYLDSIAGDDTAIIVTADHETGGLHVNAKDDYQNKLRRNGKTITYQYDTTGHTSSNVGVYMNKEYDFSTLPYYQSKSLIKNSDIYHLSKSLIQIK